MAAQSWLAASGTKSTPHASRVSRGHLSDHTFPVRRHRSDFLGVEQSWSNGPVEGHINRLKTLKRQMYGRAGFGLVRARVLPFPPPMILHQE